MGGQGSLEAAAERLEGFAGRRGGGDGFRVGDDPASPERVRFTTLVEGRPMQVVVSGWPFDRVD